MAIDQPRSQVVSRRLRRAAGQLRGVIGMLESGRDQKPSCSRSLRCRTPCTGPPI